MSDNNENKIRVAELFAGVGGFRLGLEGYDDPEHPEFAMPAAGPFETVWANQWEPDGKEGKQFAWRCYEERFGKGSCCNEDINKVSLEVENGERDVPDFDMLVGGFPCFAAGTKVRTDKGYVSIEDVNVGDMVLTHESRYRKVLAVGARDGAETVIVRGLGNSGDIECTPEHPFLSQDVEEERISERELRWHLHGEEWVDAGNMSGRWWFVPWAPDADDFEKALPASHEHHGCKRRDGETIGWWGTCREVIPSGRRTTVYNMEVEEDNSYTANGIAVHNCQSYSVAQQSSRSKGIEGDKGVLWWDMYRMICVKQPKYLLLENVDRLLKSPTKQRGRDFAIILNCLAQAGYSIEWRVVNAAEYGMPQKRRRVYIYGIKTDEEWNLNDVLREGVMARAFPISADVENEREVSIEGEPYEISEKFGLDTKKSPFENSGAMQNFKVLTAKTAPKYSGKRKVLKDLLVKDKDVPESYFIPNDKIPAWEYQRQSKSFKRVNKDGYEYTYSEGAMAFPDPIDKPARTILTGGGGSAPSRMKHAIQGDSGRIRRLVPDELDQIQMFPKGWTDTGMSDSQRAFCMGNALVTGIPHEIGKEIAKLEQAEREENSEDSTRG